MSKVLSFNSTKLIIIFQRRISASIISSHQQQYRSFTGSIRTNTRSNTVTNDIIANYHGTSKRKWTLMSLASMNSSHTNIHNNANDDDGEKENFSKHTDILLEDVNYRLAQQYQKCLEMSLEVQKIGENTKNSDSNSRNTTTIKINNTNDDQTKMKKKKKEKKVIRAVNQHVSGRKVSLKDWMQSIAMIEKEKKKALKGLHDLKILHYDTYQVNKCLIYVYTTQIYIYIYIYIFSTSIRNICVVFLTHFLFLIYIHAYIVIVDHSTFTSWG